MTDLTPYLSAIEDEMRSALRRDDPSLHAFYAMMEYHLGWKDERFQPARVDGGKRLRPIFCLLVCEMLGGQPMSALPAAVAIELLHNFSLIHDDIEDGDRTRRHRPTLWTLVGVPHAVNAGDALFALAQSEILRLGERGAGADRILRAAQLFQETCVRLVEGQYLDMSGETLEANAAAGVSPLALYKQMIEDKTAALLGAATGIGAAVATGDARTVKRCREYGLELGIAFQMTDDILGLWGEPAVTGKPAGADLRRKKKSLPVVLAFQRGGEVASALGKAFAREVVGEEDVAALMRLMDDTHIRDAAEQEAEKHSHRASRNLARIVADGVASPSAARTLQDLTEQLIRREK